MGTHATPLLLVEDERVAAVHLVGAIAQHRRVEVAGTAWEALRLIGSNARLAGAIIDVVLPDGHGLDVARAFRERYVAAPVLILTAHNDPPYIAAAQLLSAEYLCKPATEANLRAFLRRVGAFEGASQSRIAATVEQYAREFGLTPRETEILALAVRGEPRDTLAESLGTSENTLKTQVRGILQKTYHGSLHEVARDVWQVLAIE